MNGTHSERKLRLFCCACVRIVGRRLSKFPEVLQSIAIAEEFADTRSSSEELLQAESNIRNSRAFAEGMSAANAIRAAEQCVSRVMTAQGNVRMAAMCAAYSAQHDIEGEIAGDDPRNFYDSPEVHEMQRLQAALYFDIFTPDNVRDVTLAAWRTQRIEWQARRTYDSRDFSSMPRLADLLSDAGCSDERVLSHCRRPGPHVRGCWVVDKILGLE